MSDQLIPQVKYLTREEILAAQDLKPEPVDCSPDWPGLVLVQGGTGDERDAFEESIMEVKGKDRSVNTKRLRVKLLARSIIDGQGHRLFSEQDIALLGNKSARMIERLFKVAQRLWGLTEKDVEDLVGESKPGRSSGPGTESPGNGVARLEPSNAG